MELEIVAANAADDGRLHQLLVDAKAYWGYDLAWVRDWAGSYDFARFSTTHVVFVARVDGDVVAWAALIPPGATVPSASTSGWAAATCASRWVTGGDRCR